MAIIWYRKEQGREYEVRSAGNTIRLYTDGVFHSQWNEKRPLAAHIWDLLFLPALLHQTFPHLNSALVLGLGGGAVIKTLEAFSKTAAITAVDLDGQHIAIAKQFFKVNGPHIQFKNMDARDFVDKSSIKYDLIIEDLFAKDEASGDALRAVNMDAEWLSRLTGQLAMCGILVVNFESRAQLITAASKKMCLLAGVASVFCLSIPRYENAIAVYLKHKITLNEVKKRINNFYQQQPQKKVIKPNISLSRIL